MEVVKYLMTRYYVLIIQALVQHRDISSLIGSNVCRPVRFLGS